ncbi:hypothetical protein Scep_016404 [Stephania cephalantha]|uniref:Fe2OG dioxygenase domain-containing protein n=1 Tax=Stephania cephalantha TaxID=152367 RepID=A0AAP0IML7_9MAGN
MDLKEAGEREIIELDCRLEANERNGGVILTFASSGREEVRKRGREQRDFELNVPITSLQVLKDDVGWVPVSPVSGALVVNIGDFLHILSKSWFHSVLHRVVVNRTHYRYSVAFFYMPPLESKISPLSLDPPRYRIITKKDYLDLKAKHFNDTLTLIRILILID